MADEFDDEADNTKGSVAYERFHKVNQARKEALARLESIESAHRAELALIEKRAAKIQADHEAAVKRASELEQAVESERLGSAFAGLGLSDPDLRDFVRGKYLAVQPDEKTGARPPVDKWYAEFAKEKPYLQAAAPTTGKPPSLNAGAKDLPPVKGTVADIANMKPDEWKAFKQAGGRLT